MMMMKILLAASMSFFAATYTYDIIYYILSGKERPVMK